MVVRNSYMTPVFTINLSEVNFLVVLTRKWKVILLVCVIVPVGFLAAWEISLMRQPSTETVTLKPVSWEFAHPSRDIDINQWQNASFADGACSIAFATVIVDYESTDSWGTLWFATSVDISGRSLSFYVRTASVSIGNLTGSLGVDIDSTHIIFRNLSLTSVGTNSARFVGNGRSKSAYLSARALWDLNTPANYTCQATVVAGVVYFNGTMFRRIQQPFNLVLSGDKHVLEISAYTGQGVPANIPIWVNGTQYTTPLLLVLPQGTYVLKAESQVVRDSQKYSFNDWEDSSWLIAPGSNPVTFNLTEDDIVYGQWFQS
jgi:hypothetical protein